jgi:hypothetical protein
MKIYSEQAEFAFQTATEEAQWDRWRDSLRLSGGQIIGGATILAGIILTLAGDDIQRQFQDRWFAIRRQSAYLV